jgi:glutamine cyclotransferase
MTDYILEIDQDSGCVESMLDMSGLISPDEKNKLVGIYGEGNTVLNGIAFDPIENVFYVTGKNWSKFFKIKVQE